MVDAAMRFVTELGAWLWLLAGFGLMAAAAWRGSPFLIGTAVAAILAGSAAVWLSVTGREPPVMAVAAAFMAAALIIVTMLRKMARG
jgi:membrane protein implicated in regulation of membrane protease activity